MKETTFKFDSKGRMLSKKGVQESLTGKTVKELNHALKLESAHVWRAKVRLGQIAAGTRSKDQKEQIEKDGAKALAAATRIRAELKSRKAPKATPAPKAPAKKAKAVKAEAPAETTTAVA